MDVGNATKQSSVDIVEVIDREAIVTVCADPCRECEQRGRCECSRELGSVSPSDLAPR